MRKYRTVIEIVCEAESGREAIDVAGEYLRGAIDSGVTMRCESRPLYRATKFMLTAMMTFALLGAGALSTTFTHPQKYAGDGLFASDACQVPLRTGASASAQADFRSDWKDRELDRAIASIKQ